MFKSGAIALSFSVLAIFGGWLAVAFFPTWPLNGETWAVVVVGLFAALIAVWTIFSQRAIARRQCTLEHIAGLETDGDLIKGRKRFRELTQQGNLGQWAAPDKEQTEEFQVITTRLNEFELISIGIQRGIIDFELYKLWFKSGTQRAWRDADDFVKALRRRQNNDMLFYEFQIMVKWFEDDTRPPRSRWWGHFF